MKMSQDPAEFCLATRQSYEGLITKPPLTDKLLSKPPFRFLHDVITALSKKTGYLDGLYSTVELDPKNISDKEGKIVFLQKSLDVLEFTLGEKLDLKLGKVVAGHEPEKTNNFLQKLAQAARNTSPDANEKLVQKVLSGEKPTESNLLASSGGSAGSNKENRDSKPPSAEKKPKRTKSKDTTDKEKSSKDNKKNKEDSNKKSSSKDRSKSTKDKDSKEKETSKKSSKTVKNEKNEKGSDKKKRSSSKSKKTEKSAENGTLEIPITNGHISDGDQKSPQLSPKISPKSPKLSPKISPKSPKVSPKSQKRGSAKSDASKSAKSDTISLASQEDEKPSSAKPNRPARPSTAVSSGRPMSSMGRPGTAMARAAPPRLKRRELGEVEPSKRLESSDSQRETNLIIQDNLVAAADGQKADADDDFLVEEPLENIADTLMAEEDARGLAADADQLDAEEHGGLVRKILETKKELESGLTETSADKPLVVFDEREREKIRQEAQKLQEQVQSLTRTAHPLGRLVDYLQEDVDSMLKELEQWRDESKKNLHKLRSSQGSERSDLDPLKSRLEELESQIREKRDAVSAVRGSMIANELKLQNLILTMGK